MLPGPASFQRFEAISRRSRQVCHLRRFVNLPQLALRNPLDIGAQSPRETASEQRFCIAIGERADHSFYIRAAF